MANRLAGPKEVLSLRDSDHHGRTSGQAPFHRRCDAWLRAPVRGEVPGN